MAGKPVIGGISFSAKRGSMTAIIGANGCGKSTLIRLLAGILKPASGEVRFDGKLLPAIPAKELARRMAYVPQNIAAPFPFTALEVVLMGRSPYSTGFRFENEGDRIQALTALETVSAGHVATRPITELSGGERQMVSLARALAQEPECLLLDEPSASLDLKHRARLMRTLVELKESRGLSSIVVTHDLQLIDPVFDHVAALRCGAIAAEGAPAEILTNTALAAIYDDDLIRTGKIGGRTLVWSE